MTVPPAPHCLMVPTDPNASPNPYATPRASLETGAQAPAPITAFPRFSAWWVFLLTLFTLGIYVPFWLYARTRTVNRLLPAQRIDSAFIHTVLSLYVLNFALGFFEGFGGTLASQALASEGYTFAARAINIGVWVGLVIWFIQLRRALLAAMAQSGIPGMTMGPVANFLIALLGWGAVYQQYKINTALDRLEPAGPV